MWIDGALWLFASPILCVKAVIRLWRRVRFWTASCLTRVTCRNCEQSISLVGMWRCACGYTYRGHLLRVCPVCRTVPRMVRCYDCGLTVPLPEP